MKEFPVMWTFCCALYVTSILIIYNVTMAIGDSSKGQANAINDDIEDDDNSECRPESAFSSTPASLSGILSTEPTRKPSREPSGILNVPFNFIPPPFTTEGRFPFSEDPGSRIFEVTPPRGSSTTSALPTESTTESNRRKHSRKCFQRTTHSEKPSNAFPQPNNGYLTTDFQNCGNKINSESKVCFRLLSFIVILVHRYSSM